ncbi:MULTISPECIES: peptide deformylase [Methylobacterium]|mgnify:CR=1 FL=1|jgi:peptide deformylase|uniref:peptide deformylase n=1 Tax=Methylobacterium TaxID=407 RepID=UPI0008E17D8F|nr:MULTISPECIES: peptide deformylase [Methylobacterium]MBZ6416204.1 peptide deformylase [Methylobacterium sp.]MBK3399358.1 peptide deformylase [Methylobacterium ajmalii]MBK3409913.1 peptide deformylase [Methylobacterium ajmalii]MBK3422883.1 peptide deformylase [Methylobacterium ajmalii]SFF63476.1 peptide deformylase [Methylobacterium sp. yr596]
MPVRPLVLHPDPRLRLTAPPVAAFDAALRTIADDLLDTLRAVSALGLTGPHIGVPVRLTVIRAGLELTPRTYVNPELVWASPETARHREGSVSMPGVDEEIERPARVRVRWRDLDGTAHEAEEEGFAAACLQHEIDQLDGLFWIERLSRLKRERVLKRYAKLHRG